MIIRFCQTQDVLAEWYAYSEYEGCSSELMSRSHTTKRARGIISFRSGPPGSTTHSPLTESAGGAMRATPPLCTREYRLHRRSSASVRHRCTEDARRREQALHRRQERAAARAYGADGGADADAERREEERTLLAKNERAAARARLHTIAAEYAQLLSGLLGRLQQQGHIEVCAGLCLRVSVSMCVRRARV